MVTVSDRDRSRDNALAPAVTLPGLRRITVRAEAARAGMTGNGVVGAQQVEVAEISTIRR